MTPTQAAERLERAERLECIARGSDALDVLAGCEQWPLPYNERALVLRSTILQMRDPIEALDALPDSVEAFQSHDGRIGYLAASGRAYIKTRNLQVAEKLLNRAWGELRGEDDPNRYIVAYSLAYLQWNRREFDPESPHLCLALRAPDPAIRVLALNLQAWMHGGLDDHRALLDGLISVLSLYEAYGERCLLRAVAASLQSAADIAWEMHDVVASRRACALFETLEWTPDLRTYRFAAARALAWHAFLNGDTSRTARLFADAHGLAWAPAWEVTPAVDAAHVAWLSGDEERTLAELRDARELADSVHWQATRDEERMALITLASLLAPHDLQNAQRYLDLHHRLRPHSLLERMENSHEPRRLLAYQKYADAQIAAVRGNTALAVRLFSDAYDIFTRIGFVFRATLAARALGELTNEERWLSLARSHAAAFPKSAFAKRLGVDVQAHSAS